MFKGKGPSFALLAQGNKAEVFGNDVYMESWVATPAYFNPFPTSAGEPPLAAASQAWAVSATHFVPPLRLGSGQGAALTCHPCPRLLGAPLRLRH